MNRKSTATSCDVLILGAGMSGLALASQIASYNNKKLLFNYEHLDSTDEIIIEQDLVTKTRKIKDFKDYINFLKSNKILVDHKEREEIILKKISSFSQSRQYKENINTKVLEEVVNIVENPNLLHVSFNKDYLEIPKEIIISTLEKHQRYFQICSPTLDPLIVKLVDDISVFETTIRGSGGFGSTGR